MIGYETTNFSLNMQSILIAASLYVTKCIAVLFYYVWVKCKKKDETRLNELLAQIFWDDLVVLF